jgi:hypothetical protein
MTYFPKRDPWAAWVLAFSVFLLIGIGVFLAWHNPVLGVLFSMLTVSIIVSIYFWQTYEITWSHVVVRWGLLPIWWVRIDHIAKAVPTDSISATAQFAFSSDAIFVKSSKKICGFLPHTLSISPEDKTGFLRALTEASPNLQPLDDGSVRRRAEVVR